MYAAAVLEPHFHADVKREDARAVLQLTGELDVSSSTVLEEELGRLEDVPTIVLDLSQLEFVDSTGLGVLVKTHQRLREQDRRLAVIQGGGQVRRLLELTGLDQQLTLIVELDELDG